MKHLFLIIIILLFNSCDNSNSVKKQKYKIVYEINYPNFIYKDSLINDKHSKFDVEFDNDTYFILGDGFWILKKDKYPIIIRKIEKL